MFQKRLMKGENEMKWRKDKKKKKTGGGGRMKSKKKKGEG